MPNSQRPFGPVTPAANSATMPALNQQAYPQNPPSGPLPVLQTIIATVETLIASAFNAATALSCPAGPDTALEQNVFDFWASGYIKTTASGTVTLKVYEGTAIASGNLLGSSGAITQNTATATWWAHARLIFDSVSGVLAGDIEFYVNKTRVAVVTLSNFVGGFNNTGNQSATPPVAAVLPQFCMSITSSGAASGTPTTINVQNFSCG